jgi:hypothetical protein
VKALTYAVLLFGATPAHAALDELLPKRATDTANVKLAGHPLRVRTRGTVKEFAGADGKVFAATWSSAERVDLVELLGPHMDAYRAQARASRLGHHQLVFSTPELAAVVVQHGNVTTARFWVPSRLPVGVNADALR